MNHAFRFFAVLTFALAGCPQMPSGSPAGESDGAQETTSADDWETWTAVGNEPGWQLRIAENLTMRREAEFLRLLEAVHHFDITDDGALRLHIADGATITARRE